MSMKEKSTRRPTLGSVVWSEPFWGRGLVGGGLTVMLVVYLASRIIFAVSPRNISRNTNVVLSTIFEVAMYCMLLGWSSCWWYFQFALYRYEQETEEARELVVTPFPGMFRKTVLLLNFEVADNVKTVGRWVATLLEALVCCSAIAYVVCGFVLGISKAQKQDESTTQKSFVVVSAVFNVGVLLQAFDLMVSSFIHRHWGLRKIFNKGVEHDTFVPVRVGSMQPTCVQKESVFLVRINGASIVYASLVLRMINGYCPYIDYTEDMYHGGDPSESASSEVVIFVILFLCAMHLVRHVFWEAYVFWKGHSFELVPEAIEPIASDHPNKVFLQAVAQMLTSFILVVISISLIFMDAHYKIDAGMVGRILYFVGYFFALGTVQDYRLNMIILDGRKTSTWPYRVVSAIIELYLLAIYITMLVYWAVDPAKVETGNSKNIPRFDLFVLLSGLGCAVVKVLVVSLYDWHFTKPNFDPGAQTKQTYSTQDGLEEYTLEDMVPKSNDVNPNVNSNVKMIVNMSQRVLILTDIATFVSGIFKIWILVAVVINSLGLLLDCFVVAEFVKLIAKWKWMGPEKANSQKEPSSNSSNTVLRPRLGGKRQAIVFFTQLIAAFIFWVFTIMFYFTISRLPYYQPQLLVAGHRGVWTDGYAENSFEAFDFAKTQQYAAVEVDLRMTKDQKLVVMHDITLDRTTNGEGAVADFNLDQIQQLRLKREGTDELIDEFPYTLDQAIQGSQARGQIINIEVKQDKNMSAVALALDSICKTNATETSFISTGSTVFQHLLYYLQPNVTLEKDFLLHTPSMALMVPSNVNVYAISAELALFNLWVIPNAKAAGMMVLVYFLAIESPGMINFFVALGVDGFMLNNPEHCAGAGVCKPPINFTLERTM
eukprot:CAMPEP_0203757142 /NCGR_PEP_ID=MMETSP0098-20131031/10281_1 /ASSEMBLY_ACC=CAM_ASM_000208 /TAXON_ID=96639 /ORGANISM=" , Strain NY0313808BC1" /LENGTH=882 /DNA_ID=CAMNT_0050649273 /DNA_START=233 /DNA_END=2881 /DNA_ORIENTATION=+